MATKLYVEQIENRRYSLLFETPDVLYDPVDMKSFKDGQFPVGYLTVCEKKIDEAQFFSDSSLIDTYLNKNKNTIKEIKVEDFYYFLELLYKTLEGNDHE